MKGIAAQSLTGFCKKTRATLLKNATNLSSLTVNTSSSESFKPGHKPQLTPATKSKRLAFDKQHQTWTA